MYRPAGELANNETASICHTGLSKVTLFAQIWDSGLHDTISAPVSREIFIRINGISGTRMCGR